MDQLSTEDFIKALSPSFKMIGIPEVLWGNWAGTDACADLLHRKQTQPRR